MRWVRSDRAARRPLELDRDHRPSSGVATSQSPISDFDPLISRLAAPLEPGDRAAFRVAAENALVGCSGEGVAYRTLREVWRGYFRPPPDPRIGQTRGSGLRRPSKLG